MSKRLTASAPAAMAWASAPAAPSDVERIVSSKFRLVMTLNVGEYQVTYSGWCSYQSTCLTNLYL